MSKPKTDESVDLPGDILLELLTPSEIRMVKNRWRVMVMIDEGWPVRRIAGKAKVGTDTVVRMSKKINQNRKIRQFLTRDKNDYSGLQASKWVFGQIGKEK